ncbi:hypothetical protein AB6N24_17910 [Cellulomonas sp. 179-A 4D5 NHS]|uniref:hypothetical protein n=1 Tax=Cellulomonas sp. 179-A 4D5 NHS TaxID=3142378 RepID=UPI00399FE9BC
MNPYTVGSIAAAAFVYSTESSSSKVARFDAGYVVSLLFDRLDPDDLVFVGMDTYITVDVRRRVAENCTHERESVDALGRSIARAVRANPDLLRIEMPVVAPSRSSIGRRWL